MPNAKNCLGLNVHVCHQLRSILYNAIFEAIIKVYVLMIDKRDFCTAQVCTKMHNKNTPYFYGSAQVLCWLAIDLQVHENTRDRCVQVTGGKPARRGGKGYTSNIGKLAQFWRAAAFCVLCAGNEWRV